jgi:uncharacterized protein (DUF362 family)
VIGNDNCGYSAWTRRQFVGRSLALVAALLSNGALAGCGRRETKEATFIAKVDDYGADIASRIVEGMKELGVTRQEISGKRILLKPNLIEVHPERPHITTHPLIIRGAIEAFLYFGAARVVVGEGPGHSRDTMRLMDEAGLLPVLKEDRIEFVDLNYDDATIVANRGSSGKVKEFVLPVTLQKVDWVVSMPKLKTHHWAGMTGAMKNLFGLLPGLYYGWPKNALHYFGVDDMILDINATVKPNFAIVDGIVGMEGDGPIMGPPRQVGAILMGRNLAAVDATTARVIGVDPKRVSYLSRASGYLGPICEKNIVQRGEFVGSVFTRFELDKSIPAQRVLRA